VPRRSSAAEPVQATQPINVTVLPVIRRCGRRPKRRLGVPPSLASPRWMSLPSSILDNLAAIAELAEETDDFVVGRLVQAGWELVEKQEARASNQLVGQTRPFRPTTAQLTVRLGESGDGLRARPSKVVKRKAY